MNPTASAFLSRPPSAPRPATRPLRPFFASADLEETRLRVGSVMKPHRLDVAGRAQRLDARMHHASFGDVSLSLLAYGAEVEIQPGPLEDFFLVQMPLAGRAQVDSGGQHSDSGPHEATVLSPSEDTVMRRSADNQQLMVRVCRALVERTLALQLGGRALDAPGGFQLGLGWRECKLRAVLTLERLRVSGMGQRRCPSCGRAARFVMPAATRSVLARRLGSARPSRATKSSPATRN